MEFNQIIQCFQAEMLSKGMNHPNVIIADGKLHRFYIQEDKKGSKNGWYIFYCNSIPCGVFGNWKTGLKHKWCSKNREQMNSQEVEQFKQQMKEAKYQREKLRIKEQAEAAKEAEHIYHNCPKAKASHPYLVRKSIKPFYAHQRGSYLVLPIMNFYGDYRSLQFITLSGNKFFLPNGAITKHFIHILHLPIQSQTILICEGFATGAVLAEAYPDSCVIAACNAKNLKPVAVDIRAHLPKSKIIIGADIDPVGLLNAREAAKAANATIIKPKFPSGVCKKLNDFNDLFCYLGVREHQL